MRPQSVGPELSSAIKPRAKSNFYSVQRVQSLLLPALGKAGNMDRQVLTWTSSCYLGVLAGVLNLRTINNMVLPQQRHGLDTCCRTREAEMALRLSLYQPHNPYKHRARDMETRKQEVWTQTAFPLAAQAKDMSHNVGLFRGSDDVINRLASQALCDTFKQQNL